jgi:hypothetical protein
MIKISSIQGIRLLPDGPAKRAMEANASLCHGGDEDLQVQMEEDFNIMLGGNWYRFEEGDNPRAFPIDEDRTIDLLSEEWRWCEFATLENGCFMVFCATNNAGGPCLFVEDNSWVPDDLRAWLETLVAD